MNVVRDWRNRGRNLRGEYLLCPHCQAMSAVRRVACARCGKKSAMSTARLPATLRAVGFSHAPLVIETLDQKGARAPVMLVELAHGQKLAIPLAESDAAHAGDLVGAELRLVLRRIDAEGTRGPIRYGRKVAADPATRIQRRKSFENPKQEKPNE